MYKIFLLSLLTFSMNNAFAANTSYVVKYPLSAGSFKAAAVPQCVYNYPTTYWLAGLNGSYDVLSVTEDGKAVGNAKGYQTTSFVYNKITYSRGAAKGSQPPSYTRYEVCKTQ